MKRIAVLVALLAIIVVAFAACRPREVLTAEEFTSRMEAEGHIVEDVTQMYAEIPGLEIILIAETDEFEVEFIIWETAEAARSWFNNLRRSFEDTRGNVRSYRETNTANFNRFTQTTDGRFEAVVRVENTLVVIVTTSENRSDAQAILNILGY